MGNNRIILLVEDDLVAQGIVKSALVSRGYRVETANNGLEGLEKLQTVTPHLIISDLNMPKMGGLLFYSKICDNTNRPKFPILILTARVEMEKLFKDFIIDGFITKPFETNDLLNKVDSIINNKFGVVKNIKVSGVERAAKVYIAEDNPEESKKIIEAFLKTGYVVNSGVSGAEAMEQIYGNLPDVAVIKLALPDVSGDAVIMQLKGMAKTKGIKFILYMPQSTQRTVIIDKISQKAGIDCFVEYLNENQLINPANELLKQYSTVSAV